MEAETVFRNVRNERIQARFLVMSDARLTRTRFGTRRSDRTRLREQLDAVRNLGDRSDDRQPDEQFRDAQSASRRNASLFGILERKPYHGGFGGIHSRHPVRPILKMVCGVRSAIMNERRRLLRSPRSGLLERDLVPTELNHRRTILSHQRGSVFSWRRHRHRHGRRCQYGNVL